MPISNWHSISKSSKTLKSFDVTGFFNKNINCKLTLDIQIIKNLEIVRRYGFCKQKYQLQTDIRYPNHQKPWNLSTLRVFCVKMSIANWHEISKSSKTLKSFDVTGFLSQNVFCKLTLGIQIIKNLEIVRRHGFFVWKCWLQTDIEYPNHQKPWNRSTSRIFYVRMSFANWHYISKSSKTLKSFDVTGF